MSIFHLLGFVSVVQFILMFSRDNTWDKSDGAEMESQQES